MKIFTYFIGSIFLASLAFFIGCEAHSLDETKALHEEHGHGGAHKNAHDNKKEQKNSTPNH